MPKKKKPIPFPPSGGPTAIETRRSGWKSTFRWVGVGMVAFMYTGLAFMLYKVHVLMGKPFTSTEALLFFLVSLISLILLPQLVLEIQYVKVEEDGLRLRNLLFGVKEKWEDLLFLRDPPYLKFAMLRSKRFLYLLNRRDLPDFDRVVEIIRKKATSLEK